jgi:hypothetical protein
MKPFLVADEADGELRTFVPGVCCVHAWRPDVVIDESTGLVITDNGGRERCASCDVTCHRDPATSRIVELSSPTSRKLDGDRREREMKERAAGKVAA